MVDCSCIVCRYSPIKEVQEAEDPDHYIVFRSFINFCMGTADYENVNEQEVYATRENNNQNQMKQAKLSDAEINYWNQKETAFKPYSGRKYRKNNRRNMQGYGKR